VFVLWQR